MNSRRALLRTAAVLVGTAATAGLAGCTGDSGETDDDRQDSDTEAEPDRESDQDDRETATDDEPPDDSEESGATEELATHRAELGEIVDDLYRVIDEIDVTIADKNLRERIDELEPALEATSEKRRTDEGADQLRTLQALRRLLDSQLELMERFSEGMEEYDDALAVIGAAEFGEVNVRLQEADGTIRGITRRTDRQREQFADIRPDLEELDEIDESDLEWCIDRVDEIAETMSDVGNGMSIWVEGYDALFTAFDQYDDERYRDAQRTLRRAESAFYDAVGQLQETRAAAKSDMEPLVELFVCLAESYEDAAYYYHTAAEARLDGDTDTAEREEGRAEDALDRCL